MPLPLLKTIKTDIILFQVENDNAKCASFSGGLCYFTIRMLYVLHRETPDSGVARRTPTPCRQIRRDSGNLRRNQKDRQGLPERPLTPAQYQEPVPREQRGHGFCNPLRSHRLHRAPSLLQESDARNRRPFPSADELFQDCAQSNQVENRAEASSEF